MFQSLGVTGAIELVNAYAKISNGEVRRSVVHLVKTFAGALDG